MRFIKLSNVENWAIVDDEDYLKLSRHRWYARKGGNVFYAARGKRIGPRKENYTKIIFMHREILDLPDNLCTDHINCNSLDNRKENLRIATKAQNSRNQRRHRDNHSGFKGVSWYKKGEQWRAYIVKNRQQIHLGYFDNKADAAIAYNEAAVRLFGEFANTNIIQPPRAT